MRIYHRTKIGTLAPILKNKTIRFNSLDHVETTLIFDTPHYLGAFYVVLDLYSDRGDMPAEFLLRLVKDDSLRFLKRLEHRSLCLVPDIGVILIQYLVRRYGIGHVYEPLVIDAVANRLAVKQDDSGHSGYKGILYSMPFLLSVVFFFLIIRIHRSWNLPFGVVMDEYVRPVSAVQVPKKPLDGGIVEHLELPDEIIGTYDNIMKKA